MVIRNGSRGADRIGGTDLGDRISAGPGGDAAFGGRGRDTLSGGEGRDKLLGGDGDDVLFGFGRSDGTAASGTIVATCIASGLSAPLFATSAPGDPDRLFVVEKGGTIRTLDPATGTTTPFLTIPPEELSTSGEQGLLGLAFHPDYATNSKFYVYLVNAGGDLELREYFTAAPGDPPVGDVILHIPHPDETNHNGGWIAFGPDGYLYISVGDGGGGGDLPNNAQNKGVLLGKMLRIDVNGDDFTNDDDLDYAIPDDNPFAGATPGADEIWATGLRNAWRASFDRQTGDLYIADVGQGDHEEVNFQSGQSNGGENYGWAVKEGNSPFGTPRPGNPDPDSPLLTDPVIDYDHVPAPLGGRSVTGGYVYRGQSEGMQGVYFYADFITNQVWSFRMVGGKAVDAENRTAQFVTAVGSLDAIASFAEDGRGNLYAIGIDGEVFLIEPQAGAGDGADLIRGGNGRDRILGGVGNDRLFGDAGGDTLAGNDQNDVLTGGAGRDHLYGGQGADRFVFVTPDDSLPNSRRDVIHDFTQGEDRIDLSRLDARPLEDGDQAFVLIDDADFTARGQVRLEHMGTSVVVSVNLRGSLQADMQIVLQNQLASDLSALDFIL